jgi:retron-type reverse transcriptase
LHTYEDIISAENLLSAWEEFSADKRKKIDVQKFGRRLMDNILSLHHELAEGSYRHGGYHAFRVSDPKPRDIHKATVRDRLLHHAIHRILYPFFDRTFISDSYSCRIGKGTHRAMNRFRAFSYRVSRNHTRTAWVLKCDIRKFFANIDHDVLIDILASYIPDTRILALLKEVIGSFSSLSATTMMHHSGGARQAGIPLGNLTSQLFANIYMNELDQFVKHKIKARYYIRYADDFVVPSHDRVSLEALIPRIANFLQTRLKLALHPQKVSITTIASGVDFLGWVHFPDHRVLRTSTKRRMFARIRRKPKDEVIASYLGLLGHGNGEKLKIRICRHRKTLSEFNMLE